MWREGGEEGTYELVVVSERRLKVETREETLEDGFVGPLITGVQPN